MIITKPRPVGFLSALAAAVLSASGTPLALANEGKPAPVEREQFITDAQLATMVPKLVDGRAFQIVRTGPNHLILTATRAVPGDPELHENMADFFVAKEGSADIFVGGRLIGAKSLAPGEWVGGKMDGDHAQTLNPGDVLWVPAGMPHRVTPRGGKPFRYMVVKIAKK